MTTLETLRDAGILSPLDTHFACALGRIAGDSRPDVLVIAALTSRQVANGHVCLDLASLLSGPPLVNDAGEVVPVTWPSLDAWLAALRASPLVGAADAATPLVLDAGGRVYLRRYWYYERRVGAALLARAARPEIPVAGAWLRRSLDRLFPVDASGDAPDWQRVAALLTVLRRFCVISGGPGTGKTFTVVKLLALLIEEALQRARHLRVTLLAPTGKAAARLSESIRRATRDLDCADAVKQAIPAEASTIHRCLSPIAGSSTHFRYNADNPLFADVVLVDEASMVDLALMHRLLEALPARARLILLGDKDQLASVEAGAVLGDICNTGAPRSYSRGVVDDVAALSGDRLPLEPGAPAETGIWDCVVQLTRSYRYGAQSGIGALARAVNAGDVDAALAILDDAAYPDVALVAPASGRGLSESLRDAAVRGFAAYLHAADPASRLRGLERFRVLCAHRRGPHGVETLNRHIERTLAEAGLLRPDTPAYAGRPIIVTVNDYQLGLFNGDVGVIVAEGDTRHAVFVASDGGVRRLSPSRLPPHETVFAMSVHKSQGSEFDEVAVVLPETLSPVMSRELLYTAVTRARHRVTVHASREVVAQAIARRVERASGLREQLWATRRP